MHDSLAETHGGASPLDPFSPHHGREYGSLRVMTAVESWSLLPVASVGLLGDSAVGKQRLVPANFIVHDRRIFLTTEVEASELARTGGLGEVSFGTSYHDPVYPHGWTIVAHGTSTVVSDVEELEQLDRLGAPHNWAPDDANVTLVMTVRELRGWGVHLRSR